MIDLQWLTGMRPGEATIMRACDIDMTGGDVWLYTPHEHKMEHKGKLRVIPLGPQAQAVLRPSPSANRRQRTGVRSEIPLRGKVAPLRG